jgi:hypothetical protein
MGKFYMFCLLSAANFLNAQNIDFGNGNVGDILGFADYKPYLSDNLIPFTYNVLENKCRKIEKVQTNYIKEGNSFVCSIGDSLRLIFNKDYSFKKIKVGSETYKVEELFSKLRGTNEHIPVLLQEIYLITIGEKDYFIICAGFDSNINDLNSQSCTFACEISKEKSRLIPFKISKFSSIMNFGDFDNDCNLDYIYLENCQIEIYSYKNDNIEINNNLFLKIKCIDLAWNNELILLI